MTEKANKLAKDPRWLNVDILERGEWTKIPKFSIEKYFSNAGTSSNEIAVVNLEFRSFLLNQLPVC